MYPYPTAVNQHLREVCLNTEFQSTALYWKDISTNSEQNSRNCNDFEKSFGTWKLEKRISKWIALKGVYLKISSFWEHGLWCSSIFVNL